MKRKIAHQKIEEIAKSIAEKQGAKVDIQHIKGYPV